MEISFQASKKGFSDQGSVVAAFTNGLVDLSIPTRLSGWSCAVPTAGHSLYTTPPPPSKPSPVSGNGIGSTRGETANSTTSFTWRLFPSSDTPSEGRDYYNRKITQGKTSKEAIRALKRRISDVVYRRLVGDVRQTSS